MHYQIAKALRLRLDQRRNVAAADQRDSVTRLG